MPVTNYKIFLPNQTAEVSAAKIVVGLKKLWMYDPDDNLIASFSWERIDGFQVVGSAAGQVIVDGELPHETKLKNFDQLALREKKGEFLSELAIAHDTLTECKRQLNASWLILHEFRSRKSEMELLLNRFGGEVQKSEAVLADDQVSLNRTLKLLLDDVASIFKGK